MIKNLLCAFFALTMLAGCAAPTNKLSIEPTLSMPAADPTMRPISLNISSQDKRPSKALAEINRNGKLDVLVPTRDLAFLMQEILQKQMTARGFMIGSPAAADVIITINKLKADVGEGSVRHNISAMADISIIVTLPSGNSNTKTFRTSYNVQGPFGATNEKIAAAINNVLTELVSDMAKDASVSQFIKSNAR
ncbi:YajG family lipoprotein [Proteus hauseri]|uniref:YajG family lipoprotein n=1 Tax=Proteus hauseri TaxID=183417 RepID=UPI0032DAF2AA